MKNKPENVIMTEGDPKKIIFRFAQPLIFANLFQQLYNTMDTIIVGKIMVTKFLRRWEFPLQ